MFKGLLKNKLMVPLAALALVLSAGTGFVAVANADTGSTTASSTSTQDQDGQRPMGMGHHTGGMRPGVMGTVSSVNGNTITVAGRDGKTYTVDASSATLKKMETISTADISVGDTIGVQGAVNGNSVTAKTVMDGLPTPPDRQAQVAPAP